MYEQVLHNGVHAINSFNLYTTQWRIESQMSYEQPLHYKNCKQQK